MWLDCIVEKDKLFEALKICTFETERVRRGLDARTSYMIRQRLAGDRRRGEATYIASRNLKQPEVTERMVPEGEMRVPSGATVLEKSAYREETQ